MGKIALDNKGRAFSATPAQAEYSTWPRSGAAVNIVWRSGAIGKDHVCLKTISRHRFSRTRDSEQI